MITNAKEHKSGHGLSAILLFLFLIILSTISIAYEDYEGIYYSSIGYDIKNTGFSQESSDFDEDISISKNEGSNYVPLSVDMNLDGNDDIIGSSGNYIKIWYESSDILQILAEYDTGDTQSSQYEIYKNAADNLSHVISVHGDIIYDWFYNASGIQIDRSFNTTSSGYNSSFNYSNPNSYIRCKEIGTVLCFWGDDKGDVNVYNTAQSNDSLAISNINVSSLSGYFVSGKPIFIDDINNDGGQQVYFITDHDNDAYDGIGYYDVNTGTFTHIYERTSGIQTIGYDIVSTNFDGGTDEVIFTYQEKYTGGAPIPYDCTMDVFNSDGSFYKEDAIKYTITGGPVCYMSKVVVGDFNSSKSGNEACMWIQITTDGNAQVRCYSGYDNSNIAIASSLSNIGVNTYPYLISMGDYDNNGYPDILTPEYIIYNDLTNDTLSLNTGGSIITGDTDGDENGELISMASGKVYITKSSYDNLPPEWGDFRLTQSPGSPVCVDSTVRFTGTENRDYTNDYSEDLERVILDCDLGYPNPSGCNTTTTRICRGNFSSTTPYAECFFNTTGTFYPQAFIEDDKNPGEYINVTYIVQVISGIEGITCNEDPYYWEPISTEATITNVSNIEDIGDVISNDDTGIKYVLGICLIICAIIITYMGTKNVIISLVTGYCALILVTLFSFLPWWILVLITITAALVIFGGLMLFGRSSGGGG